MLQKIEKDLAAVVDHSSSLTILDVLTLMMQEKGWKVYIPGGAPREWVQGKSAYDIDISVSATVDDIYQFITGLFPQVDVLINPAFGIINVNSNITKLDINVLRNALDVKGNIDTCVFSTPAALTDDMVTRDFTINALYFDFESGCILDPSNYGLSDIKDKVIRLVMDDRKLSVDYRINIRILQFMSRGYEPELRTLNILCSTLDRHVTQYSGFESWLRVYIDEGKEYYKDFKHLALNYCQSAQAYDVLMECFGRIESRQYVSN